MHVATVRQNRAPSVNVAERAAHVVRGTSMSFIGRNTPVRFSPETAFVLVNAHSHRISA
jgi:hypothetical protein